MFVTIVVNLYAVKVVWSALGVDDYGIYNLVGGIVVMFAFLNNAMIASSQRFISFEIGTGNQEKLQQVFAISVTIHVTLAIIILILTETVGLWFLNEKLNIPDSRMSAANWVYQFSIISFIANVISVPYNACIVAHEHMKVFGYLGVLEVMFKLAIVFLLMVIPFDKLVTYAALVLGVSIIMRIIYGIYCSRNFQECQYSFKTDRKLIRSMFSFAGWSFLGNIGFSVRDQGLNIVVNLFFNVAVNAAKSIANQIGYVINGFYQNFQMALNPQITKRYAAGETASMIDLVFSGCKYSVFLMMIMVVPLIASADQILHIWLGNIAPYTVGFMQLTLLLSLIDSITGPVTTALQATGRIMKFQILISIIMTLNLPIAWIWLTFHDDPYIVLFVSIITSIIAVITRLLLLHNIVPYSYHICFNNVIFPIIFSLVGVSSIGWLTYQFFPKTFLWLILYGCTSVVCSSIIIYILGLNHKEKTSVRAILKSNLDKLFNNTTV